MAPWSAACQPSLSLTISLSLLRFMTIELVMLSNHLILQHPFLLLPQSFPESESFPMTPMNIQGLFPLGLSGLTSCSPRDSQESSTPQFKSINSSKPIILSGLALTSTHNYLTSLYICKFLIKVFLKPSLQDFEHNLASI